MTIGTKSILFGAHCFFLHGFYVAKAWRALYGPPRDFHLWVSFFVHDLGYLGRRNLDGPEGEEHVRLGARIMRWIGGRRWEEFTACHSRFWAKKHGRHFSRLCVADKLAFVITPLWLYLPMARATGELKEYMRNGKDYLLETRNLEPWEALCLQSCDETAFLTGLRSYTRRWVESHRDLAEDNWTVSREWSSQPCSALEQDALLRR
jgi:hypothetical protein